MNFEYLVHVYSQTIYLPTSEILLRGDSTKQTGFLHTKDIKKKKTKKNQKVFHEKCLVLQNL